MRVAPCQIAPSDPGWPAQVLNKIDLPGADVDGCKKEIEDVVGLDTSNAILCSAKEGIGIEDILEAIVARVPAPRDTTQEPFRALIFDSYYDPYRGVIVYFRVMDGEVRVGDTVRFMNSGKEYQIDDLGILAPNQIPIKALFAGEVGFLSGSIRAVADARVGDTITIAGKQAGQPLPGYEQAVPMVFCGLFPVDADQ